MRRPVIKVDLDGYGSLVSGYGARDLVVEVAGRAVWTSIRRGWSVQERTARDVIAIAETRGYDVLIAGRRSTGSSSAEPQVGVADAELTAVPDAGGLW